MGTIGTLLTKLVSSWYSVTITGAAMVTFVFAT
ncbi:uncharacterized protein METZ01_LOCUS10102 [marine metagenome]|uniref:Uncharacterized protein n=1 Tax=marine metagenome TaxID=408172 RepID=A0A381NTS1_9ZZZZ